MYFVTGGLVEWTVEDGHSVAKKNYLVLFCFETHIKCLIHGHNTDLICSTIKFYAKAWIMLVRCVRHSHFRFQKMQVTGMIHFERCFC